MYLYRDYFKAKVYLFDRVTFTSSYMVSGRSSTHNTHGWLTVFQLGKLIAVRYSVKPENLTIRNKKHKHHYRPLCVGSASHASVDNSFYRACTASYSVASICGVAISGFCLLENVEQNLLIVVYSSCYSG